MCVAWTLNADTKEVHIFNYNMCWDLYLAVSNEVEIGLQKAEMRIFISNTILFLSPIKIYYSIHLYLLIIIKLPSLEKLPLSLEFINYFLFLLELDLKKQF